MIFAASHVSGRVGIALICLPRARRSSSASAGSSPSGAGADDMAVVAAIEIENELIDRVTSHLNPPSSSRESMIGRLPPSRTKVENRSQFSPGRDCNPGRPRRYRCAHRSIAHPCWNFSGKTWLHLDVQDLTAGTSLADRKRERVGREAGATGM